MDNFNFSAQDARKLLTEQEVELNEEEQKWYNYFIDNIKDEAKNGNTCYFCNLRANRNIIGYSNTDLEKIILLLRKNNFTVEHGQPPGSRDYCGLTITW